MGLSAASIEIFLELWRRGYLKNITSIVEMGSQEVHVTKECFETLIQAAGIETYDQDKFANLAHWPGSPRLSAKVFYEMLGIDDYACIDLSGQYYALKHDYNYPLENPDYHNRYDLVTDFGACEHCFNVGEAYRTVHRLCKPGGLIMITQGCSRTNGYYMFDAAFFDGMAAANNYLMLYSSYQVYMKHEKYLFMAYNIPRSRELLASIDYGRIEGIGVCCVMQKQSSEDFQYPYQEYYLSEKQKICGYKLSFLQQPPSYHYVPISGEDFPTSVIVTTLIKRSPKILKRILSGLMRKLSSS